MFKTAFLCLIFLLFAVCVFSQNTESPDFLYYDENSPEFWNNLRQIPVKFLDKSSDKAGNIHFSAIFASNLIVKNIDFVLPTNPRNEPEFFQQSKDWEESIDRKTFLKKFKSDFWLTTFLKSGQKNIMISAHQFKNWRALQASYAGHPDHLRRSVNLPDFWEDIRIKVAYFYAIDGDKAHWIFLSPTKKTEPHTKLDNETLRLANNTVMFRRVISTNGDEFRVLENGTFYFQKNTVFHKPEMENNNARKVLKLTITGAKMRLRPLLVNKEYFINNASLRLWICFFDSKFQSLVRVIETPDKPTEKTPKSSRNN